MEQSSSSLAPEFKTSMTNAMIWGRYAALISFINLGLGFLQLIIGALKGNLNVFTTLFTFLLSAVITLVMSINLLNFSKATRNGILYEDSVHLNKALYHLRIYFIVMGVLFLIVIGLLILFMIIAVIAALISTNA